MYLPHFIQRNTHICLIIGFFWGGGATLPYKKQTSFLAQTVHKDQTPLLANQLHSEMCTILGLKSTKDYSRCSGAHFGGYM